MDHTQLVIFHYHLLPGGVTSVIAKGIEGILKAEEDTGLRKISVISGGGGEEDFRVFLENCREAAKNRKIVLNCQTLEELAYSSDDQDPREDAKAARRLANLLAQRFSDAAWWVHNYHIGKNPRFTQAILLTARERPEQKIFLHIHDFPENGRFANLSRLKARVSLPLYPLEPGIRYITINERDRRILMGAGIPGEVVHHLPNPVSAHFLGRPADSEEVKGRFERHMASDFPGYCPGAPWSLFPVRAIRRKNILEAALGTLLFPEKLNLVVSLPGLSSQEQGYSNLVEGLYRGGVIPGLWGTGLWRGLRAPQFEDLALSVDLVFSSSLQEGFGFFFIDAFRWGKPLFSRSLDILDEILSILPDNRAVLYDSLRVPPEQRWIQGWKKHLAALDRRLPKPVRSSMPELPGAEHFLSPDGWDFSALTPDDQAKVLRRIAADSGYLREIKRGNPRFCQNAEVILGERPSCSAENLTVLQARWGLAAFGRKVSDLLNQDSREVDFPHSQGREEKVLAAFTTPENMRPLFFPYPGVNYE